MSPAGLLPDATRAAHMSALLLAAGWACGHRDQSTGISVARNITAADVLETPSSLKTCALSTRRNHVSSHQPSGAIDSKTFGHLSEYTTVPALLIALGSTPDDLAEAADHWPIHQFETNGVVAVGSVLVVLFSNSTVAPAAAWPITVASSALTMITDPAGIALPPLSGIGGISQIMLVKGRLLQ